MHGMHHVHFRKRGMKAKHPFPAKHWHVRVVDRLVLLAGIVSPMMTLPQIYKIYSTQEAMGVSALSWGAFALLDVPWVVYGIVHRDRAITITYILWTLMNVTVACGAIIYG